MTDAEKCRKNAWPVGTILEGDEGYGPTRIVITAIGEEKILARKISQNGTAVDCIEMGWTLGYRDWKKV